jgi:hypothetical protein
MAAGIIIIPILSCPVSLDKFLFFNWGKTISSSAFGLGFLSNSWGKFFWKLE